MKTFNEFVTEAYKKGDRIIHGGKEHVFIKPVGRTHSEILPVTKDFKQPDGLSVMVPKHTIKPHQPVTEAKWETPPQKPADDLKRGERVSFPHPDASKGGHTLCHGNFCRSADGKGGKAQPGHPKGHLVKVDAESDLAKSTGTSLHWVPNVYRGIEDAWPSAKPPKKAGA